MTRASKPTAPELPTAYLFLENEGRFIRFLFNRARTLIGSADDNDIVIRDPSMLPRHAEIFVAGDELHLVAVAGGRTEVAGEPVLGVRPLRNGDEIRLGAVSVLFAQETRRSENTLSLIVERAGDIPFGVSIAKPVIRIGRSRGDLLLEDDTLLPTHALIENFCANGVFVLHVKGKGNTWLNGEVLDGRRRLHDGDELRVGTTRIGVGYAEPRAQPVSAGLRWRHEADAAPAAPAAAATASPVPRTDRTEMVDAGALEALRAERRQMSPASHVVTVSEDVADAMPLDGRARVAPEPESAQPWRPPTPETREPLLSYPELAAAEDFVGARHYLPRTYRAGKTREDSPEAAWAATPEKQRRRPGQGSMTTAIPSPARVRRASEEARDVEDEEERWYQPDEGRKRGDGSRDVRDD